MKAILVLKEMPSECIECPFHRIYADGNLTETHCTLMGERNEDGVNTRADWCPLKPMPKKYIEREIKIETERDAEVCTHGITLGRNLLIEEIER